MTNQTILVLDSDPLYLAMIREFLSEEGYAHVVCVQLACAEQALRATRPALVLLEIHAAWPSEGLRLLDWLRRDPLTTAIPVIICTTSSHTVAPQAAAYRCNILEKPFQLDELLACVQASIGLPEPPV